MDMLYHCLADSADLLMASQASMEPIGYQKPGGGEFYQLQAIIGDIRHQDTLDIRENLEKRLSVKIQVSTRALASIGVNDVQATAKVRLNPDDPAWSVDLADSSKGSQLTTLGLYRRLIISEARQEDNASAV